MRVPEIASAIQTVTHGRLNSDLGCSLPGVGVVEAAQVRVPSLRAASAPEDLAGSLVRLMGAIASLAEVSVSVKVGP